MAKLIALPFIIGMLIIGRQVYKNNRAFDRHYLSADIKADSACNKVFFHQSIKLGL